MRLARRGFAFAALAALALVSACGDDNDDNEGGTAQDLSGSYELAPTDGLQITFTGSSPVTVQATGTATLTATTYTIVIESPDPVYGPVLSGTRTGTYTATGTDASGTWTQVEDGPDGQQLLGTYSFDSATGTLILVTTIPSLGQLRLVLIED
jgi:hypothetical protein